MMAAINKAARTLRQKEAAETHHLAKVRDAEAALEVARQQLKGRAGAPTLARPEPVVAGPRPLQESMGYVSTKRL